MSFERFHETMDPDDRKDYTFRFKLPAGEAIDSAVVAVVDSTSENELADTGIEFESTQFGQISGRIYGVTVWITASGVTPGTYYLRCRGETDAFPITRKFDKTMKLIVEQR